MNSFVLNFLTVLAVLSAAELESDGEILTSASCKVNIIIEGDFPNSNVVYSEYDAKMVDYNVHQWCQSHSIYDLNECNQLRNHYLQTCFPEFLNNHTGSIHVIVLRQNTYNIQMRKTDNNNMNLAIDRFCVNHLPSIDPSSPECMQVKSDMTDSLIYNRFKSDLEEEGSALLTGIFLRTLEEPTDVRDHLLDHVRLATDCEIVMEIGVRGMTSTWAILRGLSRNQKTVKKYIGVDLYYPADWTWQNFENVCVESNIACTFLGQNDMSLVPSEIGPVDMLFIDALHTYCHVLYELITFHSNVRKYIALHDTSAPWGTEDEPYSGDYSEYPEWFDTSKRGVFTAVLDFLAMYPEWSLTLKKGNSFGYTLLERVQ